MSRFQKVVWNEGMFLSPHHFQMWEHYFRDTQNARFKAANPYDWGLTQIAVDEEELANGSFSLLRCEGVSPDGLPFDIPNSDRAPETRLVGEHFSHTAEKLDVFLGIPVERTDAPNCRLEEGTGGRETRYHSALIDINDENTGENRKEIRIARTNFKILFSGESLDDYINIKIDELERNPAGMLTQREKFIPPCLYISASKRIMGILRGLLDMLAGLSTNIARQLSQKSSTQYELQARDFENFAMLSTINSFIPLLSHYYHQAKINPEVLYRAMAQFSGALTIFSTEVSPRDIVPYDHSGLTTTFNSLDQVIKRLLKIPEDTNCVTIPLQKISEAKLQGEIPADLLESAPFFLALSANVPEGQLQNMIPQVIRISSPEQIDFLIENALRGVGVSHTARPHPAIPIRVGFEYFKLTTTGDLWENIKKSRQIAFYLPPGIPDIKLELLAVKE